MLSRIGPYEVQGELGRGGMGVVYLGRDTKLDRRVAIKALPEHLAQDPERLARFEREAKTLAQLTHPNVAGIHGVEEQDGARFLVLEYVEGETLAARLDRGPLPPDEALAIALQIADGVEAAHQAGVIHRDLKPGNVMVTPDGKAKVLDFGLARAEESSSTGTGDGVTITAGQHSPTVPGVILGTAAYMSPEQARGRRVDRRTDIWSFGVIVYEMLTGASPFVGETASDSIGAVLHKDIDLDRLPPDTPPRVRQVLRRCLQRDRNLRLRDIGDARLELAETDAADAAPPVAATRSRAGLAGWVVAALAVLGLVAVLARVPRDTPEPTAYELSLPPPPGGQWLIGSNVGWGAISPDGKRIVCPISTSDAVGLWLHALDGSESRLLPRTEEGFYVFWSPDSRSIGFFERGSLQRLDVDGGLPERVCVASWGRGGSWSPDGRILLTPEGGGAIHVADAAGGETRPVTVLRETDTAHYWPEWLPDGEHFLYFIRSLDLEQQGIYIGRVTDGAPDPDRRRVVASSSSGIFVPASDRGPASLLWVEDGTLLAREFDWRQGELVGPTARIAEGIRILGSQRASMASASNEGTLVWAQERFAGRDLAWVSGSGDIGETLPRPGTGDIFQLSASPDGKWVSFVLVNEGQADVWVLDTATGRSRALFNTAEYEEAVTWSPDSREIMFTRGSVYDESLIMRMPVDGSAAPTVVLETSSTDSLGAPNCWLRGGWALISGRAPDESRDIHMFRLENPEATLTDFLGGPGDQFGADASPDGDLLLYASDAGGQLETFLASIRMADGVPTPGADRQRVPVEGVRNYAWSLDGSGIILQTTLGEVVSVPVDRTGGRFQMGTPVSLFRVPATRINDRFAPSLDGRRFLMLVHPEARYETLRVLGNWRSRVP